MKYTILSSTGPAARLGLLLCAGFILSAISGAQAALDFDALREKVQAALNRADNKSALALIHEARRDSKLNGSDDVELALLEAESQDDMVRAKGLLEGLLAREGLPRESRGRAEKALGLRLYLGEDFGRALPHLELAWQNLRSGSVDSQEASYFAGLCAMEERQYSKAQDNFRRAQSGDPDLRVWAQIGSAETNLRRGEPKDALKAFELLSRSKEAGPYQAFLLSRQAACLEKLGRGSESTLLLNRIRSEYPDSLSAIEAQEQLRNLPAIPGTFFVLQTGAFSDSKKAQGLAAKFSKAGYSSRVVDRGRNAKVRYKVWSGRYTSRPEALRVAGNMKQKFKISYYIFQEAQ